MTDLAIILTVAALIQLVLLVVFLVMAANVGKIRQLLEKPPTLQRQCPHCLEPMNRAASVCPHCARESEPWRFQDGYWWIRQEDGRAYWYNEQKGEWIEVASSAESKS